VDGVRVRRVGGRRSLGLLVVVSLISTLAVVPALPAQASPLSSACPSSAVPATAFTDTVGSVHRAAVDCAAWWDVTRGRTATSFAPATAVTRGQVAAMLDRLLHTTGIEAGRVPSAGFVDTVGHQFEAEIDRLAALGVVQGISRTEYAPGRPVTRAQMASLLSRLFELGYDAPLPAGPVPFTDVPRDNVHRDAIGRLVGAQIAAGTSATTYQPGSPVRRGQMASFVMRSTSRLVDQGDARLPTRRPAADDPFVSATRGAWVHLFDGTLKTRSSIRRMVAEMDDADVNLIVAQVIRRHDAYYDSQVLPRTPDPTLADGLDVLDELLTAAHARGIEVHAWFSVAPAWHRVYEEIGASPSDLGAPVAWRTYTVDGQRSTYLDPALPQVQDHVAAVVGELAANYPVDGIHLDYVRYESNRHGYHPDALARYRSASGTTGTPSPTDPSWAAWRRGETRRVIQRARAAIEAAGSDAELSAAVISWGDGPRPANRSGFTGTRTFTQTLQDWETWTRRGDIDVAMPMNYFREHDATHAEWYRQWLRFERWLSGDTQGRVVPGVAGYLNRPGAVLEQVRLAMYHGDGALVYSVQQPTDDGSRAIWRRLSDTRWGYPPARP
jgi:uncharacterized lipoprotein YddW (UPF0748 family)